MSDLTNDELKQNMAVLEAFVTTALGIIIAMSGPDPGKQKAVKTLDLIKEASKRRLIEISSDMPVGEHVEASFPSLNVLLIFPSHPPLPSKCDRELSSTAGLARHDFQLALNLLHQREHNLHPQPFTPCRIKFRW